MDFTDWIVDVQKRTATHSSGFKLEVEGNPRNPSAVHPGKFPPGTSSLDQVRLVRTGVEAIVKAAGAARSAPPSKRPKTIKKPQGSANRPTLSLKRGDKPPED